jgi:hypothetical protein
VRHDEDYSFELAVLIRRLEIFSSTYLLYATDGAIT